MKKLNVSPPAEVALTVEGNSIKVVSLSVPKRAELAAAEERLALKIVRKEMADEKEDLENEPFDALAWVKNWYESNFVAPLRDADFNLNYAIETYDDTKLNLETLDSLRFRFMVNAKELAKEEAILSNESTKFSTIYAGKNNGRKPPQSLYEAILKQKADSYATYAMCHHFIRDADGDLFFNPVNDFANTEYSPERETLNEWLITNKDLQEVIRECNRGNLLGFIQEKAKATEALELLKKQADGVNESPLPERAVTE